MSGRHPSRTESGAAIGAVAFGLLTISDTRTGADDDSGSVLRELVLAAGHRVHGTDIVSDDPAAVGERILAWALDPACDAIASCGGTGLTARDRTVEAVSGLFDVRIDGFGELFRMLSFDEIGSSAMLSRAAAGIVRGTPVFLLPGSPKGVRLALTKLVLPEIAHVLSEVRRQGPRY